MIHFYIDEVLKASRTIIVPEGRLEEVDEFLSMISTGFVNRTPWDCPRDIDEEALARKIDDMADQVADFSRCIFNCHAPPYGTPLDLVPSLDEDLQPTMGLGVNEVHAGSVAVRKAIEKYQPRVGLHGHMHEQHGYIRLGSTLCFNPGSEYERGSLQGVFLEFRSGRLRQYGLTREEFRRQ